MITKLLNELNEKTEILNNLIQDNEYFKKLDERIEKVNKYNKKLKNENKKLNDIIDKTKNFIEKYLEEHIIEDQPDEQSIFYDEKGYYIPNAKEQLLNILDNKDN